MADPELAVPHLLVNFTKKTAPECNTKTITVTAGQRRTVDLLSICR
jgi:hypothetical protein